VPQPCGIQGADFLLGALFLPGRVAQVRFVSVIIAAPGFLGYAPRQFAAFEWRRMAEDLWPLR
jgi:hypothetical protein